MIRNRLHTFENALMRKVVSATFVCFSEAIWEYESLQWIPSEANDDGSRSPGPMALVQEKRSFMRMPSAFNSNPQLELPSPLGTPCSCLSNPIPKHRQLRELPHLVEESSQSCLPLPILDMFIPQREAKIMF